MRTRNLHLGILGHRVNRARVPKPLCGSSKSESDNLSYRCEYCGLVSACCKIFFHWRVRGKSRIACAFCAQCLHLDRLGSDNGLLYCLPEIPQSQLILALWRAYSTVELGAQANFIQREKQSFSMPKALSLAKNVLKRLNSCGSANWQQVKANVSPSSELRFLTDALKNAADISRAIRTVSPILRYVPILTGHNRRLVRALVNSDLTTAS